MYFRVRTTKSIETRSIHRTLGRNQVGKWFWTFFFVQSQLHQDWTWTYWIGKKRLRHYVVAKKSRTVEWEHNYVRTTEGLKAYAQNIPIKYKTVLWHTEKCKVKILGKLTHRQDHAIPIWTFFAHQNYFCTIFQCHVQFQNFTEFDSDFARWPCDHQ